MLMQLGVDGCFVGSGIFKSTDPKKRAHAMVQAVTFYRDPETLAKISEDLGEAMVCGSGLKMIRLLQLNEVIIWLRKESPNRESTNEISP